MAIKFKETFVILNKFGKNMGNMRTEKIIIYTSINKGVWYEQFYSSWAYVFLRCFQLLTGSDSWLFHSLDVIFMNLNLSFDKFIDSALMSVGYWYWVKNLMCYSRLNVYLNSKFLAIMKIFFCWIVSNFQRFEFSNTNNGFNLQWAQTEMKCGHTILESNNGMYK